MKDDQKMKWRIKESGCRLANAKIDEFICRMIQMSEDNGNYDGYRK